MFFACGCRLKCLIFGFPDLDGPEMKKNSVVSTFFDIQTHLSSALFASCFHEIVLSTNEFFGKRQSFTWGGLLVFQSQGKSFQHWGRKSDGRKAAGSANSIDLCRYVKTSFSKSIAL